MHALITFLQSYGAINNTQADIIAGRFIEKQYQEGEYLFNAGKVCKELFFIVSGVVRTVATNNKGIDITHFFIGEKQFCTILQSFAEESVASDSIQACCDTTVLSISKKSLQELYKQVPAMLDLISQHNQERMLEKIRLKNLYAGEDAVERYKIFQAEQTAIAHFVPLNYIASYLNVTPQSLSRIRKTIKP